MLNHDAADDPQAADPHDFYDTVDPLDASTSEYRETSRRMISFMMKMLSFIHEGTTASLLGSFLKVGTFKKSKRLYEIGLL